MATLPNSELAILDLRKLEDYCLDPAHPRGRHKARVFREALAINRGDSAWLRQELLSAARTAGAIELEADRFGRRWRVDVTLRRQNRSTVIRTLWLMRTGETVPRFVTCWVL